MRWQVDLSDPTYISSIGITLANGSQSPMFTVATEEKLSEIKEIDVSHPI